MTNRLVETKVLDQELVVRRQSELAAAAARVLLRQGFHRTTVRQIAAEAGWTMGMLYQYISRKEDVLCLVSTTIMTERLDALEAVPLKSTASEQLYDAISAFFGIVARTRREVKLLYREAASLTQEHLAALKPLEIAQRQCFTRIIRRGAETGEFRRDVDPELLGHTIIMLAHMWALKGWAIWESIPFERFFTEQTALIFEHLLPLERRDATLRALNLA